MSKTDSISSPSWHEEVLNEREESIKKGGEEFVDWNSAKKT
ncbi:MAG: addiction module protein [Candidatus Brocadia sp.]|nr:addiction module protein [Candidatus Brocadia sp.]